jgi:hypothetical protein
VIARRLLPWTIAGTLLWSAPPVGAQVQGRVATVSLLEGTAQVRRGPRIPQDVREGSSVHQGDVVETGDDSRLELRLPDASALRIGPRARLGLTAAHFERGPARRRLSVRLFFGKVWAKVTSVAGGDQRFQVETENAVAGVRGTTFRVDAHEDRSVLVRVYSGTVAVRRNAPSYARPGGGGRREVPGPEEVSRDAWEKLVGKQMQILISSDGTPGLLAPFSEADEKDDDWSAWNRKRDEQGK